MLGIDHINDLGIGRIVHYVAYGTPGGEYPAAIHRAAIITRIDNQGPLETITQQLVSVCILNPTGIYFATEVPYDETGKKSGTWHWPERDTDVPIKLVDDDDDIAGHFEFPPGKGSIFIPNPNYKGR